MQHEDFSIALFGKQSLLCLPNKDKVTSLKITINHALISHKVNTYAFNLDYIRAENHDQYGNMIFSRADPI